MSLSTSIHMFLGFALGGAKIFLKKGGKPLTLWTLWHQRGFTPNSCVELLRHHSSPLPVHGPQAVTITVTSWKSDMCIYFPDWRFCKHPAETQRLM